MLAVIPCIRHSRPAMCNHVLQAVLHLSTCITQHVLGSQACLYPEQAPVLVIFKPVWVKTLLGDSGPNTFGGHSESLCCNLLPCALD